MRKTALLTFLASSLALAAEGPPCSVMLTDAGTQKISVIKVVRQYTTLGLKDAKDLVEAPKPKLIRDGLSRKDAEALVAALAAVGASAEVHPKGAAHGSPHAQPVKAAQTFEVKLESFGASKIMVIKIVRDRTGLGLAETKKLVESAPVVVATGQSKPLAESMLADLLAAGAKASISPMP